MDHLAADNHLAAMLEEIEHSEQGSGFVPDKKVLLFFLNICGIFWRFF